MDCNWKSEAGLKLLKLSQTAHQRLTSVMMRIIIIIIMRMVAIIYVDAKINPDRPDDAFVFELIRNHLQTLCTLAPPDTSSELMSG